jgi:hypothetical protein
VVELGSMRERKMVRPSWLASFPNRVFACVLLRAGIQAVAPPNPRMVWKVVPKFTVAVDCAIAVTADVKNTNSITKASLYLMIGLLFCKN